MYPVRSVSYPFPCVRIQYGYETILNSDIVPDIFISYDIICRDNIVLLNLAKKTSCFLFPYRIFHDEETKDDVFEPISEQRCF